MQVQINSDNTISMHTKLSDSIGDYIINVLRRFDPYLTRVEVHLTGEATKTEPGPRNNPETNAASSKPAQTSPSSSSPTNPPTSKRLRRSCRQIHRLLETTYGRLADKRRRKHR